jgi:hypothetical protein
LTAETIITPVEDPDDYKAFEQAVTADYEAETAVERELVLRLASLLWRLRRATSIETGLLQIQDEFLHEPSRAAQTQPSQDRGVATVLVPTHHQRRDWNAKGVQRFQPAEVPPPRANGRIIEEGL